MLCHTESKPAKSFIVVPSEKIQERAKVVLDRCETKRLAEDEAYIRNFAAKLNKRRKRWPQWLFNAPQLDFEQARQLILWEKQEDEENPAIQFNRFRHLEFPTRKTTREEVADRLLAMSKVERRVIVSSNDFDWFFR